MQVLNQEGLYGSACRKYLAAAFVANVMLALQSQGSRPEMESGSRSDALSSTEGAQGMDAKYMRALRVAALANAGVCRFHAPLSGRRRGTGDAHAGPAYPRPHLDDAPSLIVCLQTDAADVGDAASLIQASTVSTLIDSSGEELCDLSIALSSALDSDESASGAASVAPLALKMRKLSSLEKFEQYEAARDEAAQVHEELHRLRVGTPDPEGAQGPSSDHSAHAEDAKDESAPWTSRLPSMMDCGFVLDLSASRSFTQSYIAGIESPMLDLGLAGPARAAAIPSTSERRVDFEEFVRCCEAKLRRLDQRLNFCMERYGK